MSFFYRITPGTLPWARGACARAGQCVLRSSCVLVWMALHTDAVAAPLLTCWVCLSFLCLHCGCEIWRQHLPSQETLSLKPPWSTRSWKKGVLLRSYKFRTHWSQFPFPSSQILYSSDFLLFVQILGTAPCCSAKLFISRPDQKGTCFRFLLFDLRVSGFCSFLVFISEHGCPMYQAVSGATWLSTWWGAFHAEYCYCISFCEKLGLRWQLLSTCYYSFE